MTEVEIERFWQNTITRMDECDISWQSLAERIGGTSKNNLASLKSHKSNVSVVLAAHIAHALGTTIDSLYYGSEICVQDDVADFRRKVFDENMEIFKIGHYKIGDTTVNLQEPPQSTYYEREFKHISPKTIFKKTIIEVRNKDTLDVAKQLRNLNPLVLCMADRKSPDEKAIKGFGTHAAHLMRSSNIFLTLNQIRDRAFPMNRNYGGIYSPDVSIFRDLEENGYSLLAEHYKVSIVSVAALYRPFLDAHGNYLIPKEIEGMKNKIRTILNIAITKNHTVLVLSSFGCGASKNPPLKVAKMFKDILSESLYVNSFEKIVFAIKEKSICDIFKSVFSS